MAKSNKTYVIGSCAFVSGFTEMGIQCTKECFKGKLNQIESFLSNESKEVDFNF